MTKAVVTLFKQSGKYYTEEEWEIPEGAIGPHDMINSPDFRRIDGGVVLVNEQEPWGFPCLFPAVEELFVKANRSGIGTKEYQEIMGKFRNGSKSAVVLPTEPVSEQEKFFKALNEGKVFLKPFGNETTINIKP